MNLSKKPKLLHSFSRAILCAGALVGSLASPFASAQLTVEITGAGANRIPVAIGDFAIGDVTGERIISVALTSVIRTDLDRSGLFRLVDTRGVVAEDETPNFADLKTSGADAVAGGTVRSIGDGRYAVRMRLTDVQKQTLIGNQAFMPTDSQLKSTAHRLADFIYEKLTGEVGVFSTRIAYVVKSTGRYELQIADADGGNPQSALSQREPIISPTWSPEGSRIAYVSFEAKKPIIYVHNLASGKRHVAANFKGSNSAPAWSPDGKRLAVVLTKDGNSQLYFVNADGSGITRVSSSPGIDTEPRWSPDGKYIYFTSDRGGSPQIYRLPLAGDAISGPAERLSFDGTYNVTPRPSPDGKSMAFITRANGRFQLALMDLASKQIQLLTDSGKDESPSFAPNGRMILYATEIGGRGVLAAVSSDGRVKQKLSVQAGDVREPTWGPLVR